MNIEEFIEKYTAEGEQSTVGENLILNRGPANQDALPEMEQDLPEGTNHSTEWGFGDDVQRLWFNPNVPFMAGFSKLSHSIHIWRYPNRLTYIKHSKDVGEFFSKEAFTNYEDIAKFVEDPDTPDAVLEQSVADILKPKNPDLLRLVLGDLLDISLRELQVDIMIDKLAE